MSKPVNVTLFHATWCGHCKNFMPEWKRLLEIPKLSHNIDFVDYESSTLDQVDQPIKTINGEPIAGYPTIKVSVLGKEYEYDDQRKVSNILQFIKNKINENGQNGGHQCTHNKLNGGCDCDKKKLTDSLIGYTDSLTEFTV